MESANDGQPAERRIKFYGLGDYATFYSIERAFRLIMELAPGDTMVAANDVLELHNAMLIVEAGLTPRDADDNAKQLVRGRFSDVRRIVGIFFTGLRDENLDERLHGLDYQYRGDFLRLMGRNRAFERCSGAAVIGALQRASFPLGDLLSCSDLVRTYDHEVRDLILSNSEHAEQVIAKHLQSGQRADITLPSSLTASDIRTLIESYINGSDPNANYLQLVANARPNRGIGIDARLKLLAKRAYDKFWSEHFETNEGLKTGCEVRIDEDQVEAVVATLDGLVATYSYSRSWLKDNRDEPTILNNFVYLFEFSNIHMLLNFPSYQSQLGIVDRFMKTTGRESYLTGAAFDLTNNASFLQVVMYENFLRSQEVELEDVIAWFFRDYLKNEFGAEGLRFQPASRSATFLEKSRHLFSEMESVLKQYTLYVENGELDIELLSMTSEQLLYAEIPSLVGDKYVYVTNDEVIQRIQHLLFSDQSGLTYIDESQSGHTFAELIKSNTIPPEQFHDYQQGDLQFLATHGVVTTNIGEPVKPASLAAFRVLECLNAYEAASYYHFGANGRAAIDDMVSNGWVERASSLLTRAETSFFNYILNQSEFSNGPDLRNKYLHGSQAAGLDNEDDRAHYQTYVHAMRLLIALVIKINDDMILAADYEGSRADQV